MSKQRVNDEALNISNPELDAAIAAFQKEATRDNLVRLMTTIRTARLLIPAKFHSELTPAQQEVINRGKLFEKGKAPEMHPILVENQNKEQFAPAFTSREALDASDEEYPVVINVNFDEVMRIASQEVLQLKGILLNPYTSKMVLHPNFITAMQEMNQNLAAAEAEGTKEVQMSLAEFVVFARKNVEYGILPKLLMTRTEEFMKQLDKEREAFVLKLYQEPYGENIPCSYGASDFDVMLLNVDEDTAVASIDVPVPSEEGLAHALYVVYNPKTKQARYFIIACGTEDQENQLIELDHTGEQKNLGDAPVLGSGLYYILDLIKEN